MSDILNVNENNKLPNNSPAKILDKVDFNYQQTLLAILTEAISHSQKRQKSFIGTLFRSAPMNALENLRLSEMVKLKSNIESSGSRADINNYIKDFLAENEKNAKTQFKGKTPKKDQLGEIHPVLEGWLNSDSSVKHSIGSPTM
jgi:hypothetical protein